MAKKSKRPPARKQQPRRPQPRPATPQQQGLTAPGVDLPDVDVDGAADDYASGALPVPDSDGPMPLPPAAGEQEQRPAAVAAAVATERRRVGRIQPAGADSATATAGTATAVRPGQRAKSGRAQATAAMFEPLPPDDAAIPFDRVPYVPGDLRRVLVIAGLMVVLIVVANFAINAIVK